jgi:acyl-CoA synthetase (AMP-forming)/AMP-acid ligase II
MNRSRAEWDDLTPDARAAKLSRAGAPALGVQLRTDEEGEILARSNHVLLGYWNQPDATADALDGGWFHTGDGGFIDEEHYLTISDRKKDVIISGGENVSSIEVEDCLYQHPAVAEAAVIGVPHEKWGETVKALVVLAPGTDPHRSPSRHNSVLREQLAHYKCPPRSVPRSWPAPPRASCRSTSCARPTGRAARSSSTERRRPRAEAPQAARVRRCRRARLRWRPRRT